MHGPRAMSLLGSGINLDERRWHADEEQSAGAARMPLFGCRTMGRGPKTDEETLSPGCDAAFDVHHGHPLNCLTSPSAYHDSHGSGRSWTCHGRQREALSKYITPVPQVSMYMLIGCREVCVSMANIQTGRHTSRQFCQPIVKRQLAYRLSEPRGHDPFERIYRPQKRHGWPSLTLSLWFRLLAWSRIRSDLQTYLDHSPATTIPSRPQDALGNSTRLVGGRQSCAADTDPRDTATRSDNASFRMHTARGGPY